MKPHTRLACAKVNAESLLELFEHDGEFSITCDGVELMHSRANASECLLGELGVERVLELESPRVLIGGLGLGFTLRSVLEALGPEARVDVVELSDEVITWNQTHLLELNGRFLEDSRVQLIHQDVTEVLQSASPLSYDVVLLDVDNGPQALVAEGNASLYSAKGLRAVMRILTATGRSVFWSGGRFPEFEKRLRTAGFSVRWVPAKLHEKAKKAGYTRYVADRP